MINVSAQYNTNIANGGHIEWQILNNGTAVPSIEEGSLNRVLYESASIGNVIARELNFTYYKGMTIDTTYPLVLQFRATGSTNSAWYDMGQYWVDTIETSPYTDKVKVKAFDALLKANVTYLRTGTWTATTDKAIVTAIASDIGVSIESGTATALNTSITISDTPSIGENGTTSMQMLSYIGVMRGGNWIINDDNKLQLITLFDEQGAGHDAVDIGDAVQDFDASPSETITGVCLWVNDNFYYRHPDVDDATWEGYGGRKLEASLPIGATQTLADDLYTALGGKSYYPYSAPVAWVDPKYQLGDKITIKNVASVICNQTIQLTALATSALSATAQEKLSSDYPYLTPQERKLAQTEQNVASIQIQSDSIQSTVSQMTEEGGVIYNLQTEVTQNANGIEAVNTRIDNTESYLRWDGSTATLSIGESTSPTEAQVSPDGFAVVQNGETILEAKGHKVTTTHFKATDTLTVGRYQWADEDSNGYTLFYIG